jgi:hypothetical protein
LYQVAQALMTLQALCGPITKVSGQGRAAKQVIDLLKRLRAEQGPVESPNGSGIDHVLLIDRGVDLLSPLATQLTYEGLVDELFSINNSKDHLLMYFDTFDSLLFLSLCPVRLLGHHRMCKLRATFPEDRL